ncbi:MAG TPA: hypothetical protein VFE82_12205 [Ramlibacter sp.]|uniref:hypothetical protein n=1 Tax=Ramlibacter sp. TaxID=1917967 RepID=UPI002D5B82D3|nr:hypothetical protein [Ramlibacter sp.]HZY19235.1 hypothetical protein [Ramlibacter sp.]
MSMITLTGLLRPLGRLLRAGWPGRRTRSCSQPWGTSRGIHTAAGHGHVAWPPKCAQRRDERPLRVLRIVDEGHAPSTAGRMVISGRMADVCAELERLAALEAAAA